MSRAKLFNMIKSHGSKSNSRNPFDLSNFHVYSQKAAYITPIKVLHTLPGDYFDINVSDFSQTMPLNTAAFLRGKKELSAYFVPYNTLWHNFNQYIATREDPESAVLQARGISYEPRITLKQLLTPAFHFFTAIIFRDYFISLLYDYDNASFDVSEIGTLDDYKNRFYDYTLNHDFNTKVHPSAFTLNFVNITSGLEPDRYPTYYDVDFNTTKFKDFMLDIVGHERCYEWLRKLDMLGYGNYYPLFKYFADKIANEYENAQGENYPDLALNRQLVLTNNLNILWLNLKTLFYNTNYDVGEVEVPISVSPFPLLAYNKIFYDMFRNTYYDLNFDVRNYNVDFLTTSNLAGSYIGYNNLPIRFFDLYTHQWKKDMFTGLLPDTQFGAVSQLTLNFRASVGIDGNTERNNQYKQMSGLLSNGNDVIIQSGDMLSVTSNGNEVPTYHTHRFIGSATSSGTSSVDVIAIRRAECLQQYRMDLLRAGNRTSDIFKQIYGETPKSSLDESPYFINAVSNDIFVDPVVSTAATGNADNGALGDIAARALVNGSDLHFKFSTNDFGMVLFLAYVIPESMYNSYRLDPHLVNLDVESRFIPQLQNLGFEPIFGDSLNMFTSDEIRTRTIGFAPSYLEFKTDIDLAHGDFCDLVFPLRDQDNLSVNAPYVGSRSHWVALRTDLQLEKTTEVRDFYINPAVLDNVFSFDVGADFDSDQFICATNISVKAIRQLSELGLPQFC